MTIRLRCHTRTYPLTRPPYVHIFRRDMNTTVLAVEHRAAIANVIAGPAASIARSGRELSVVVVLLGILVLLLSAAGGGPTI